MEKEPKKISFGFNKLSKKPNLLLNKEAVVKENKVQLIECVEEKSIKVVGGDESKIKEPLVIPMKQPNKKLINLVDIVKNNFEATAEDSENQENKNGTESVVSTNSNLTLEEQAAKELLNDVNKVEEKVESTRIIEVDKEKVTFEGEKESTVDDYENVPIEEFGKAMLRGMGWKDGCGIGKNEKLVKMVQPSLRPKGMGLGADKLAKQDKNAKPAVDRDGKVLKCVKGAYVKVIAGYHKGNYGQIIGLDDESGRFIIKTALNNLNISLNEFLVVPVTKEEYNKNSKVINNAKYEEYIKKKQEELEKQKQIKEESDSDEETYKSHKEKDKVPSKKSQKYDYSDDEGPSKRKIKQEIKSSDEETHTSSRRKDRNNSPSYRSKENKYSKKTSKYDSDEDDRRDRKPKQYQEDDRKYKKYSSKYDSDSDNKYKKKSSKYNSDDDYRKSRRDNERERKSKKYSDDSDDSDNGDKKYKKSSKYDDDSSKKKHKKKKSKKHSSDDSSDERYKRKSKKSDRKYKSDSEDDDKYNDRSQKKSKKRDKKDRDERR